MEPGPLYLIFLPSRLRERQERNGMRVASALLRWSEEHSIALYQNELMKSLINFITPILRCAPFDAFSLKVQLIPRSENKRQTCTPPTTPGNCKYCHKTCDASIIPTQTDITKEALHVCRLDCHKRFLHRLLSTISPLSVSPPFPCGYTT